MTFQHITQKALQLIAIESTAANIPGLHHATDFISMLFAPHHNITVERFESNGVPSLLVYYGRVRPASFTVLLNAHIDVVPGKSAQFKPYIKDNMLYGRGAYDMKVAALLMAQVFIDVGNDSPYTVGLQITCDEEIGGYNGVVHQLQQGVTADFVVTGEMTDLGICNEARGLCWVELAFKGKSAHGGYAWNGKNAIIAASDFVHALTAAYPTPTQKQWATTASVASIATSNRTYNIVPDEAIVKIDFRFTHDDTNFKDVQSVHKLIASFDPTAEIIAMPVFEPAVSVDPTNPHLQQFMSAFTHATGTTATLIRRYASSDGRHFALHSIPSIEFGLVGADHHSGHEYVDLTSMEPFYNTLCSFLQKPLPILTATQD